MTAVRVRVPATSANLGPAFDCAGLALAQHDVLEFALAPGGLEIAVSGVGAVPTMETGRVMVWSGPISPTAVVAIDTPAGAVPLRTARTF